MRRFSLKSFCILAVAAAGCGQQGFQWPAYEAPPAALVQAGLYPFQAGHLVPRDSTPWDEYDPVPAGSPYAPNGDPLDETRALIKVKSALLRLQADGARQVIIDVPYAWTTEPGSAQAYGGNAFANVVYSNSNPDPALSVLSTLLSTCQAADMSLVPFRVPETWVDAATTADPTNVLAQVEQDAEAALDAILNAADDLGMTSVLYLQPRLMQMHPQECQPCMNDGDCDSNPFDVAIFNNQSTFDVNAVTPTCVHTLTNPTGTGTCHVPEGTIPMVDPSRNFTQFFTGYQTFVTNMVKLVAAHAQARDAGVETPAKVALIVLGDNMPYTTGAGQARFADNSLMSDHRADLATQWQNLIAAARAVPWTSTGSKRPLLTYAAQNLPFELRTIEADSSGAMLWTAGQQLPEWMLVPFWSQLDAVGIDFYQPTRDAATVAMMPDAGLQVQDMVEYMMTHNQSNTGPPNLSDIEQFTTRSPTLVPMYPGFGGKPVLMTSDGVPAVRGGSAQPNVVPVNVGADEAFDEQSNYIQSHLLMINDYMQHGWLAGLGLQAFQANLVPDPLNQQVPLCADPCTSPPAPAPNPQWLPTVGGQTNYAATNGGAVGFDYFGLFDTPAEAVIKQYWTFP